MVLVAERPASSTADASINRWTVAASFAARRMLREQLPAAAGQPRRPQRQPLGRRELPHAIVQRSRTVRRRALARFIIRHDDRANSVFHHQVDVLGNRRDARNERDRFDAGRAGLRNAPSQLAGEPRAAGGFADPIPIAQERQAVLRFGGRDQSRRRPSGPDRRLPTWRAAGGG